MCLAANAARADQFTWDGGSLGSLMSPSNWSPIGVPGTGDDIRFHASGPTPSTGSVSGTLDIGMGTMRIENWALDLAPNAALSVGELLIGQAAGTDGTLNVRQSLAILHARGATSVGQNGTGALNLSGSALGYGTLMRVGENAGSDGTFRVSDWGTFLLSDDLHIGLSGTGDLAVETAGYLESRNGTFGYYGDGVGTGTVSGSYSFWSIAEQLTIGVSGRGRLDVTDGGIVESNGLVVGQWATGDGTLALSDSSWVYVNGDGEVGTHGTGAVSVSDYSGLQLERLLVGMWNGSHGEVTVTGPGSWIDSTNLTLGYDGDGRMTISDRGDVTTGTVWLAAGSGATGSLTVRTGGTLASTDDLYVGLRGAGDLAVSSGGSVLSRTGVLGWADGAQGTAIVTGAGSLWDMSGEMRVGSEGSGSLTIADGGKVQTGGKAILGQHARGDGLATVTGTGSRWTISDALLVGDAGDGDLLIENGARVENTAGYVAYTFGSTSSVAVENGGTWAQSDDSYVGFGGTGSLAVRSGGSVSSRDFTLGYHASGEGRAYFTGAGSSLDSSRIVYVGRSGMGEIAADNGAELSSVSGSVGVRSGSTGSVVLSGAGTLWDTSDYFVVGRSGNGTALIEDGATLTTGTGYIASNPTGVGDMFVTDAGSLYRTTGDLHLAPQGDGSLTVANGAEVEIGGDLLIGTFAGSTGMLSIGGFAGGGPMAAGAVDVGRVLFGDGTGAINFNHTETAYQFDADIAGRGSLNLLAGTTALRGDLSGFTGLTGVASGAVLNVSRDLSLDSMFLAGGTVDFSLASGPARQLELRGALANAGRIEMRNTAAGDSVSVSGDYVGGGVIGVDVDFGTGTADTLKVAGDVTGAPTLLQVADVSSVNASGDDIVLASVAGQTRQGDFALAAPISSGAYSYDLSLSAGAHVLAASFLPDVTGLEGLSPAFLYHGDTPRLFERVKAGWHAMPDGHGANLWANLDNGKRRFAFGSTATGLTGEMRTVAFSAGAGLASTEAFGGTLSFGAHVRHAQSTALLTSSTGTARIDIESASLGASATWATASGFYLDAVAQGTLYTAGLASGGARTAVSGHGLSASLEMGKHFTFSQQRLSLTPQARLVLETAAFDPFTTANRVTARSRSALSAELSLGGTASLVLADFGAGRDLAAYGSAFVTRQMAGPLEFQAGNSVLGTSLAPWTGEMSLGLSYSGGTQGSMFVEGTVGSSLKNPSLEALSLRAGVQLRF